MLNMLWIGKYIFCTLWEQHNHILAFQLLPDTVDHSAMGDLSIVTATETSSDSQFMDATDSLVLQAAELEELGFRTYYDNGSNSHFVDTAHWG
jgi:hypothetical protein